jgi:hypothetical protein
VVAATKTQRLVVFLHGAMLLGCGALLAWLGILVLREASRGWLDDFTIWMMAPYVVGALIVAALLAVGLTEWARTGRRRHLIAADVLASVGSPFLHLLVVMVSPSLAPALLLPLLSLFAVAVIRPPGALPITA